MNQIRIFVLSLLSCIVSQLAAQQVTIDLTDLKQPITGFGGAHVPEWGTELSADQIDKVFGNAPGQVGLTILRIPVPTDSTQFPIELPGAVRAKQNGAIVLASPWSPPAYMKTNDSTVLGELDPDFYDEYALYLDSFATYMAVNGAPLYAVSLQNEPDFPATYTSCEWTPTDFVNFLTQSGSKITSTKVLATESLSFNHDYTDPILNNPAAEPHVDILGGHLYGTGGIQDYPLAREKGKEVWMTEHYLGGTSYSVDMATAKEIHDCMMVNYNAYVYWTVLHETGFLSSAGDILKRGYIMSQYAKFIRPGATRVGATTSSVSNVDVTAYKNDTNVVIVAINRNASSVSLNFTLDNAIKDQTFTKFVTSQTKNVANEGEIASVSGAFPASLDAMSVTTFTTFPDSSGKAGNIAPVANAGFDTVLVDTNGDGFEVITLDASASSDADGSVAMYTWSEGGKQIAAGVTPEVQIKTGIHTILLTITDSDGALASDTVVVTVNLQEGDEEIHLWFEAECADVGSQWDIISDPNASNNTYLEVYPGNNKTDVASEDSADHVVLNFTVPDSAGYTLWVRCRVPGADDDSYWVKMDDGEWTMWNNIQGGSTYQWAVAPNGGESIFPLDSGDHVLTFAYREDGAELDKFYITNMGTVPTEFGEDAENCPGFLRPVARAGSDQTITVTEGSEWASVTLNGSASSDPDGSIVSYRWTLADTVLATGANPEVSLPLGTHRITLSVTDDYGQTASDNVTINVTDPVGIEDGFSSAANYQVYPNPFSDNLKVAFNLNSASQIRIEIADISGRIINTPLNKFTQPGNFELEIETNSIQNGVYFLTIFIGNERFSHSVLVKE